MDSSNAPQPVDHALQPARWRLRFGIRTLLLGVAAVGVALAWLMRTDRFYDSLQVYAFQSTADGQTLRGAVAFVRQNRLYPNLRRLQFVILVESGVNSSEYAAPAELEMKHLGNYLLDQRHRCPQLVFVDDEATYGTGWSMCFDETMFQMGAAYEVCGMRDTGPYDWPGIAGGKYALAIHTRPLTLTWEELLEFVQDPTVGAWTNEAVHRWREGRH